MIQKPYKSIIVKHHFFIQLKMIFVLFLSYLILRFMGVNLHAETFALFLIIVFIANSIHEYAKLNFGTFYELKEDSVIVYNKVRKDFSFEVEDISNIIVENNLVSKFYRKVILKIELNTIKLGTKEKISLYYLDSLFVDKLMEMTKKR